MKVEKSREETDVLLDADSRILERVRQLEFRMKKYEQEIGAIKTSISKLWAQLAA